MRKAPLAPPTPVRGYVLPWKTDVLPPRNEARYAAKAARVVEGPAYATSEVDDVLAASAPSRPLVDVLAGALGISKGKTRKAIQGGKALVRGPNGGERQVFDPDYRLAVGETARLDD